MQSIGHDSTVLCHERNIYNNSMLTVFNMDTHENIQWVNTEVSFMLPVEGGIIFRTYRDNVLNYISHDMMISKYYESHREINDVIALSGGNVAIISENVLTILNDKGHMLSQVYDVHSDAIMALKNGDVGLCCSSFMSIYSPQGKLTDKIYLPNTHNSEPYTELFDGRFAAIVNDDVLAIYPRNNGIMSWIDEVSCAGPVLQLFDGRFACRTHDGDLAIYSVNAGLEMTICVSRMKEVIQLPDSRLLCWRKRAVLVYTLKGELQFTYNAKDKIDYVSYAGKNDVVCCHGDTVVILDIAHVPTQYNNKLYLLFDTLILFT